MKRSVIFILFGILSVQSFSQSSVKKVSDLEKAQLLGKVESIKETKYNTKESSGTYIYDTIIENPKSNRYNKDGYVIEEINYEIDGSITEKWNYVYDSQNHQLEGKRADNEGTVLWNSISKYDEKGNMNLTSKYEEGNLIETSTYKYDPKGNCIEISSEAEGTWKENFTYDGNGNKTEIKSINPEGKVNSRETYAYDSKSNMIEKLKFAQDGSQIGKETYKYTKNGYQSEYNYFSTAGNLLEKNTYLYDSKGNITEHSSYREDGTLAWKISYTYAYDKNGNWIIKTEIVNGKAESITQRVIKYY